MSAVPAGGEDVTRPAKKKRGVVRAGRFFLFVMIVAAIVVVVYQAHKRSETVQGMFETRARGNKQLPLATDNLLEDTDGLQVGCLHA